MYDINQLSDFKPTLHSWDQFHFFIIHNYFFFYIARLGLLIFLVNFLLIFIRIRINSFLRIRQIEPILPSDPRLFFSACFYVVISNFLLVIGLFGFCFSVGQFSQ